MFGSALVYSGFVLALAGVAALARRSWRRRGVRAIAGGFALAAAGLLLPARETRIGMPQSQLDRFAPAWQFHEVHGADVDAPPDRVYAAIRATRADEILLFRTLTWIRRCGQPLPEGILNAGHDEPLLDIATRNGFVWLADERPHEVVVGTVVIAPPGSRGALTPATFAEQLPPGFALAAMNFAVTPNARGGSRVTTETRVFANSDSARRRFAAYWRVIYPGSALIRRMWLRAVVRRAER